MQSGDAEGWLELDTGAGQTSISAQSPLVTGLQLEAGGATMGIGGQRQPYSIAREMTIANAGFRATVDPQIVETSPDGCGADGLLRRDALRSCVLVLGGVSIAIACG